MNKTIIIAVLTIAACGLSSTALSAPTVSYNPANGGIWFQNDTGAPLANASILSTSGKLKTASSLLDIPGAYKDDSELPFAFTYLGLPVGLSFAGYIVQPGSQCSDLQFEYRTSSLTGPLIQGGGFCFPEPSSCAMTAVSAVAFWGTARRGRGWRRVV
ncbi:MAG: hypothetical protein C0485_11405 [Pirellula sp.]|nr:hypothetical protein [Pirellula sp.]